MLITWNLKIQIHNMVLTFEYVDADKIITKERGVQVKGETITPQLYQIYNAEKSRVDRSDIELIPPTFFRFLNNNDGIDTIRFNQHDWCQHIAPKLSLKINQALMPFQKHAIYRMVKHKRALNAADMGLGKSLQGLSALLIKRNPKKGDLILCPGGLRANWAAEIKKWVGEDIEVHVITKGGKKNQENSIKTMLFASGIKIVSFDMAATFFKALTPKARNRPYFNTVILDESHNLKNANTKRFVNLCDVIKNATNLFLLSGTPCPNRPVEFFSQFSLLQPGAFKDKRAFTDRYCDGKRDRFNRYDDRGASNLRELAYLTRKMVIRMRREDFLNDLPALTRQRVILSPSSYPKAFKSLMKEFNECAKKVNEDEYAAQKLQTLASQMFRETAKIKEKPVIEYLQQFTEVNRDKTVLFVIHQTMFNAVSAYLTESKQGFIAISGKTKMNERMGLIKEFLENPKIKYALLTLGSCSTGLNLIPAPQMLFLELSWEIAAMLQAECRINRIGGAKHLRYWYLICEQTLDERVFNKLLLKLSNTNMVLENGREYNDLKFDKDDDLTFKRKNNFKGDKFVKKIKN